LSSRSPIFNSASDPFAEVYIRNMDNTPLDTLGKTVRIISSNSYAYTITALLTIMYQ
jgi:hypothetical protein